MIPFSVWNFPETNRTPSERICPIEFTIWIQTELTACKLCSNSIQLRRSYTQCGTSTIQRATTQTVYVHLFKNCDSRSLRTTKFSTFNLIFWTYSRYGCRLSVTGGQIQAHSVYCSVLAFALNQFIRNVVVVIWMQTSHWRVPFAIHFLLWKKNGKN